MAESRSGPYIWVTWLSKLLVGDLSCEWAAWFKSHYKNFDRMPSTFDSTAWQIEHTALLNDVRDRLEADGKRVMTESQNYFNLRGNSGTMIGGKPDLVVFDEAGHGTIYDIKTGRPSASDNAQVMIYMYALPHINQFRGVEFDGRLVYRDNSEVEIPSGSVNEAFKNRLFELIRRVAASEPARKVPSGLECGFCELTLADCPERVDQNPREAVGEGGEF